MHSFFFPEILAVYFFQTRVLVGCKAGAHHTKRVTAFSAEWAGDHPPATPRGQ